MIAFCEVYQISLVLISTYWNVNKFAKDEWGRRKPVLISTYWNVNPYAVCVYAADDLVLISTYWNVNKGVNFSIA